MPKPKTIHFDGACPFLTCLETGPHDHEVCPVCDAVRYGNLSCNTCRKEINRRHGWNLPMFTQEELDAMKIPPPITYSPTIYSIEPPPEEATCQSSKRCTASPATSVVATGT